MKRLFDVFVSLGLIIFCLPLMILVALIIKLNSPGPILFSRRNNGSPNFRIGKDCKPFRYFKFRSMYVGTETVTSFGIFIRRWHLDELPELFLVLTGKMSLVGPRPTDRDSTIRNKRAFYKSLRTKPGMTGPIQIHRGINITVEDLIRFNRWYSLHQGFFTDLMILIKTPFAILNQNAGVKNTILIL